MSIHLDECSHEAKISVCKSVIFYFLFWMSNSLLQRDYKQSDFPIDLNIARFPCPGCNG